MGERLTRIEVTEPVMLQSRSGGDALRRVPAEGGAHEVQALRRDLGPDAVVQRRVSLYYRLHHLHPTLIPSASR